MGDLLGSPSVAPSAPFARLCGEGAAAPMDWALLKPALPHGLVIPIEEGEGE